jgi:hypothetical protein
VYCLLLCTAQKTTSYFVCCVLLWNRKWEELQGHMDCPSSLDEFRSVNQSVPTTDNFSVIQRNHYVNYACSRHFSVLLIHRVMATKYCVN